MPAIVLPTGLSIVAIAISAFSFVSQLLSKHALARDLENLKARHEKSLEVEKADRAKELVEFKTQLDQVAQEQATMFSLVLERRTEAIAVLYELFVRVESVGESFLEPRASVEHSRALDEPAYAALRELKGCFEKSRILLPSELCEIAEFYLDALHHPIRMASLYLNDSSDREQDVRDNKNARIEQWKKFRAAVAEWRPLLESEMRKLVGSERDTSRALGKKRSDITLA
jgi:hypothetical protein